MGDSENVGFSDSDHLRGPTLATKTLMSETSDGSGHTAAVVARAASGTFARTDGLATGSSTQVVEWSGVEWSGVECVVV